jgi:hypothetical protein
MNIRDMMNAPSANQGISRADDNGWAAPTPPEYGNVKASCHDPHSWLYPHRENTSLWSAGTFDNGVPPLKDEDVTLKDSNDAEFNANPDAVFDDYYIWPHPASLAHIALPDEHDTATRERECTPWKLLETTPSTSTYGHTWLVPIWDERDEDARFWSNAKHTKASRD